MSQVVKAKGLRGLLFLQVAWIALILILGIWWGSIILNQADTILELEQKLGIPEADALKGWFKMKRMLKWEFSTFFLLLFSLTILILKLHWQNLKRSGALQSFFASMGHELRTPLTSIRLQSESIFENTRSNPTLHAQASRLLEDAGRLESQVEKSLELARIEGGGSLHLQSLRMRSAIESTLRLLQDSPEYQFPVTLKLGDSSVLGDPVALKTIFRNLLENTLRHSGSATPASTFSEVPSPQNQLNNFILEYRDNGMGLPSEFTQPGILFEKGARSQGAGLGLYIIRSLMEQMGGKAEFHSGSPFKVHLTFRKDEEARNAS